MADSDISKQLGKILAYAADFTTKFPSNTGFAGASHSVNAVGGAVRLAEAVALVSNNMDLSDTIRESHSAATAGVSAFVDVNSTTSESVVSTKATAAKEATVGSSILSSTDVFECDGAARWGAQTGAAPFDTPTAASSSGAQAAANPLIAAAMEVAASTRCAKEAAMTRSQKKWKKREEYREKKRQRRPEERRRRRRDVKEKLLSEVQHLSTEEQRKYLRQHREEMRQQRAALLEQLRQRQTQGGGLRICFNCSFDSTMMNEKEIRSLAKQLFLSYHLVKRNPAAAIRLFFSSFSEENRVFRACRDLFSFDSWIVSRETQPFWEVFRPEEIVVLSPDAKQELESLETDKVYVIGALVDRTISRCESQRQAKNRHVECRRLPFKTYVPEQNRLVLNINTVVETLIHYRESNDWREALLAAVPQRLRGVGGRKKQRIDKKRQRRSDLLLYGHNDTTAAQLGAAAAAQKKRESTWCGGRGRCNNVEIEGGDIFNDSAALSAISRTFAEEETEEKENRIKENCEMGVLSRETNQRKDTNSNSRGYYDITERKSNATCAELNAESLLIEKAAGSSVVDVEPKESTTSPLANMKETAALRPDTASHVRIAFSSAPGAPPSSLLSKNSVEVTNAATTIAALPRGVTEADANHGGRVLEQTRTKHQQGHQQEPQQISHSDKM